MKNKIVIFNIVIVTLALLTVFFSSISINKNAHRKEAEKEIITITDIYAENYSDDITSTAPAGVRITVIDADKTVIADSEDSSLVGKPHENREEITAAWEGTPKVVTRKSESLGAETVYYAEKVAVGNSFVIVRTAIKVETINEYVFNTLPTYVYVFISVLFVSYIAGILATMNLVKPLEQVKNTLAAVNNGETVKPSFDKTQDAGVREMLGEITDISEKLQNSIKTANSEKERLDYILSNVSDGIVVLDDGGIISVMNKVACKIFCGEGFTGRNYTTLTADEKFRDEIKDAYSLRESRSFEFETDGKTYMVSVSALENSFTVVVLTDITQMKNGERMRGEFFANASHELKTPLTAVKGFNDLISLRTTDDEIKAFTQKSDKEITRLISLISDMLDLSKLETLKNVEAETLDLGKVAAEVKESLSPLAASKKVAVTCVGNGNVKMEREHAVELVKNLVENAIRYNNENGEVKITVSDKNGKTTLTVADNGIGIEEEHLNRIFERFYRVNKSRSRETGGTGLGLSIVKHICTLYGTEISVSSRYGVGTTVTVTF